VCVTTEWRQVAVVAVGGLIEVGFDETCRLLLVASHQGRGLIDCPSGERIARDGDESYSWLDASGPTLLGVGPLQGQSIQVAGLSGGSLATSTPDGWRAQHSTTGIRVSGPDGSTFNLDADEELRAFGFSADGSVLVLTTCSTLTILRRDT
jgi:hypothetical protein